MITLTVKRHPSGRIDGFCLSGHAGSGPHGYDLVCAGVSAVSFGAVNAVEALTAAQITVSRADEGGKLTCHLDALTDDYGKAALILEAMLVAMQTIAQSYSKYLRIIDEGGGNGAET
ncbi:MAG: ribosomal-processing cysteine protease Prp [Sporolactobacillus sp.]